MGFFESLAKFGKEIANNETVRELKKDFQEGMQGIENDNSVKSIPEKYNMFPKFEGKIFDISEQNKSEYERCTLKYNSISFDEAEEFINNVIDSGFIKKTNVRYERDNTYVIVEYKNSNLHIVYHIKK